MAVQQASHIVASPRAFLILRIKQLVVALIVLGLNAYHLHFIPYNVYAFSIAIASITLVTSIYHIVATTAMPRAYNAWAVLALDVLMTVLWLVAFALMAALASTWSSGACYDPYWGYYQCSYKMKRDTTTLGSYWGAMVAVSIFGAVEFVLFLISLTIFSVRLHRHRKAGLPIRPFAPPPAYNAAAAAAAHYPTGGAVPLEKLDAPVVVTTSAIPVLPAPYHQQPQSPPPPQQQQQQPTPSPYHHHQPPAHSPYAHHQHAQQQQQHYTPYNPTSHTQQQQQQPYAHAPSPPLPPLQPLQPLQPLASSPSETYTPSPITSTPSLAVSSPPPPPPPAAAASGNGGSGYYQKPSDGAAELQTHAAARPAVSELGTYRGGGA